MVDNHNYQVSVIIPAYNCGDYLPECLDSIINQSYTVHEIIIVNDGSTDNTESVIDKYSAKHPSLFKVIKQANGGAASARNAALPLAEGDFIAFLDGDDYIWPDYFETLIGTAIKEKADIVTCGYQKFYTGTDKIKETRDPVDWDVDFGGLRHIFQYSPCAKIIKTQLIFDNDLRFGEGEIMEDGPFGIMTNSICKNNVAIPYYGYRYRIHKGSVQDSVRTEGLKTESKSRPFPCNGLRAATLKVREVRGAEYDQVLEYCVCKALAGFVYSFSRNSNKEGLRFTCDQCANIVSDLFPNISKNPYIKLTSPKKIPLTHRAALCLFSFSYKKGILYPTARVAQALERLGDHL